MHAKKLIEMICNSLTIDGSLSDIKVISEFPSVKQEVPLQKTVVSVGLEGISITGTEVSNKVALNASPINYKIGMTLCVPKRGTGASCHDAIDRVLDALKPFICEYSVTDIKVGEMKYSSTLSALTVLITVNIYNGNAYK